MTTKQAFICAAIVGASLCRAQTNIVYYGANTNALNVVFEDTNLSVSNQTLIVTDLNICLQSEWGKKIKIYFRNKEDTIGYFDFINRDVYYRGFPRDIVATPSGPALHIPQWLSNAYTNSFAFTAAHSNIVATAYEFVAFLNSTNFPNIQANDWPNYYFAKNTTDAELIADAPRSIWGLAEFTYYPPSIRSFGYMKSKAEPGSEWFVMTIPFSYFPFDGIMSSSATPAIWHDGRWKFMDMEWFRPPDPQ